MKLLLFSDLHVHPWSEYANTDNKLLMNSRLLDTVSVVDEVSTYALDHSIRDIAFGGDLLHRPGIVPTSAYKMAAKSLRRMQRRKQKLWAVDGNHDHADRSGRTHALQALAYGGLCNIVSSDNGWRACEMDNGALLVMFSYCDSSDLLQRRLDSAYKYMKGSSTVALFHHGFVGARVGTALEYVVREEIDASTIASYGFDYIFSGHYHTHQSIKGVSNGHYIGSPLEHVRGQRDPDDSKGFLVYDFNRKKFERIPVHRPRFVKVTQRDLDKGNLKICKGNFVDVEWEDYKGGAETLASHIRESGAKGVRLVQISKSKVSTKSRVDIPSGCDTTAVLKLYVEHKCRDLQSVKSKKLFRLGRELMQQLEGEKRYEK